jgi:hypothetical protein
VLLEVVDAEQMRRIITRLARVAEGGNLAAAKLILSYTLGKPADVVDPDRLDLEDVRLRLESPSSAEVAGASERIRPDIAIVLVDAGMLDQATRLKAVLDRRAAASEEDAAT